MAGLLDGATNSFIVVELIIASQLIVNDDVVAKQSAENAMHADVIVMSVEMMLLNFGFDHSILSQAL
jgi:hypothetical protein